MYNINKVTIEGNLTRDPELKAIPSGQNVATFSIATNRKYKDKDGNMKDETEYHNIVIWGKDAENAGKYLGKGNSVFVEGRLQTRSWEKDGVKQYRTEVVAERITYGSKPQTVGNTGVEYPTDEKAGIDSSKTFPEAAIDPNSIPF